MPNVLPIQKEFLPLQPQKRKTFSESSQAKAWNNQGLARSSIG